MKKLTICALDAVAESKGGRLIDRTYVNNKTLMRYVCSDQHEFRMRANDVRSGHWCPFCAGHRLIEPIDEMKRIAEKRGGECLATTYINNTTKLSFRCAEMHQWEATADTIKNGGRWCPFCAGQKLLDPMSELVSIAAKRGGVCLETIYINNRTKMRFRCANNHVWEATSHSLKAGHWCAVCAGLKIIDPLLKLKQIARERGGECLSNTYHNRGTRVLLKCELGHIWSPTAGQLLSGQWCPTCGIKRRSAAAKSTLTDMGDIAAVRGGKCLSKEYIKTTSLLDWECADGHQFPMSPAGVVRGQWCPACRGRSEALVRQFMECLYSCSFPQTTPAWLKETGYRLDGYSEEKRLAFEYHGQQHVEHVEHFHRGQRTLSRQQKRDEEVRNSCLEHGVRLIEIWPLRPGYTQAEFVEHVVNAVIAAIGEVIDPTYIEKFLAIPFGVTNLARMRALAETHGGECLSTKYLGSLSNLTWRCANGHIFESKPASLLSQKSWCKKCADTANGLANRLTVQDMQAYAESKGGLFLSPEYKTSHTHYLWQCAKRHQWKAKGCSIRQSNSWCPYCAGRRRLDPLGELQRIAEANGGCCLDDCYVNTQTPLEFRCASGHIFKGYPRKVRSGNWCPYCSGRKRVLNSDPPNAGIRP